MGLGQNLLLAESETSIGVFISARRQDAGWFIKVAGFNLWGPEPNGFRFLTTFCYFYFF